jgi:hypothetical protein
VVNCHTSITLSNVPPGFDVKNGLYPGWCVDGSIIMARGDPHNVLLYSSLTPPSSMEDIDWAAINYILNHKQGAMIDVQDAIWCITGDKITSEVSSIAQDMANEAQNTACNPAEGAILAVICLPQEDLCAQPTIIELSRCGLSPGYWKHNVKVCNGGPGHYSGTPAHESDQTMESYASAILAAGYPSIPTGVDTPQDFLQWANMRFQDNAYKKADPSWLEIANWFNAAAGLTPYSD